MAKKKTKIAKPKEKKEKKTKEKKEKKPVEFPRAGSKKAKAWQKFNSGWKDAKKIADEVGVKLTTARAWMTTYRKMNPDK